VTSALSLLSLPASPAWRGGDSFWLNQQKNKE
jgi:hypothetical protein